MDDQAPAAFPKMLYRGGQPYDAVTRRGVPVGDIRLVHDAAEEAEAREEGFEPAFAGDTAEAEHTGDPAPNSLTTAIEYLGGGDSIPDGAGADTIEGEPEVEALAEEPPADADGDGHDDKTGQFVAPKSRKRK